MGLSNVASAYETHHAPRTFHYIPGANGGMASSMRACMRTACTYPTSSFFFSHPTLFARAGAGAFSFAGYNCQPSFRGCQPITGRTHVPKTNTWSLRVYGYMVISSICRGFQILPVSGVFHILPITRSCQFPYFTMSGCRCVSSFCQIPRSAKFQILETPVPYHILPYPGDRNPLFAINMPVFCVYHT